MNSDHARSGCMITARLAPAATAAALALALAAPGAARADDPPTLAIQGQGIAFATPDTATFSVGVRSAAHQRTTARSRANARTAAVLRALAAGGVPRDQITTSGIQLSRTTLHGRPFYSAANTIDVRVTRVAGLGRLLDAMTAAGADSIDGPSFAFSDPSAGRADAARAALTDARHRADDIAAAAGERITGIQSIVVDPDSGPQPYAGGAESAPAAKQAPTQVSPGRQEVDATVDVVYTIAPA